MTQRYARTYTSEQAVQAHSELSPVAQLEAPTGSAAGDTSRRDEVPARDLLPPQNGARDISREPAANVRPPREEANVAATKNAMKPGVTLVAKYKGT